jgi:hypothetical protein
MTLQDELLDIERGFWTGDAEFYRRHADERCLTAFPGMAAVMSSEEIAGTVGDGPRWDEPDLDVKGLVTPTGDVAILSYETTATRGDGDPYHALVSSAYVRRDDGWKLAFHQQTPLGAEA